MVKILISMWSHILLKLSWNFPEIVSPWIKFEMKHLTCQRGLFHSENSFPASISFQSGVWTEFRTQFLSKVRISVVRHFSPPGGPSRAFQTPIFFADANLKDCSRTSPLRDEGFWRVKGAPGMVQISISMWSHILLKLSWNYPEIFLKLSLHG